MRSNFEVAGVEIDILARDPSGMLTVIEVKSGGSIDHGVMSWKQRARLQRVAEVLATDEPVEVVVAVVESSGEVLLIEGFD